MLVTCLQLLLYNFNQRSSLLIISLSDVDVYGGPAEPCPYESDIAIDTRNIQDAAHIAQSQDDLNLPVPAASEEVQDAGATEPSNDVGDDDEEANGCDVTDGDGVVTEVPALRPVPEARARVPTMRRRSARLRRPAVATRTPYMEGKGKDNQEVAVLNWLESGTMVLNSFLGGD
ncbi:Hypothetical predicted protein [Olea europaea subsp. europaea]|uniref:Uncharacterized protein n=1 Tax=Olea europaea subsp. europaea TaxID=158383 RepID=A0A8S0RPN9_OLEEU|nr:Hypothetical predicted protein [Olea europaea subsp. europaea]